MKFCFILTQDLESPSGLGRYYPWGKELNKLGHEVQIIALHGNFYDLKNKKQDLNFNFHVNYVSQMHVRKIGNTKQYFSFLNLFRIVFLATIRLTINACKSNADVYIVGKPHPMNGIAGIVCKIFTRNKLIIDCDDDESYSGNFKGNWQKKIIHLFELAIPKSADLVTTNTMYSKERILKSGVNEDKVFFLSNGVDPTRFENIDEKKVSNLKEEFGLVGKKVIAYIGSMSLSNHAVILLIDAFALVIKEINSCRLLLVGGGEDFEEVRNYLAEEGLSPFVIITGRVDPAEVKYYYKLANLTVDPVYDDIAAKARSPLKIFESWACGVPVLSSEIGDRVSLKKDISDCLVFSNGEGPIDYKIKILDFFRKSSFNNQECYELTKAFYWETICASFLNYYEKIFF